MIFPNRSSVYDPQILSYVAIVLKFFCNEFPYWKGRVRIVFVYCAEGPSLVRGPLVPIARCHSSVHLAVDRYLLQELVSIPHNTS